MLLSSGNSWGVRRQGKIAGQTPLECKNNRYRGTEVTLGVREGGGADLTRDVRTGTKQVQERP